MASNCLFQALYRRRTFLFASSLLVDNIGLACLVAARAMVDAMFVYVSEGLVVWCYTTDQMAFQFYLKTTDIQVPYMLVFGFEIKTRLIFELSSSSLHSSMSCGIQKKVKTVEPKYQFFTVAYFFNCSYSICLICSNKLLYLLLQ